MYELWYIDISLHFPSRITPEIIRRPPSLLLPEKVIELNGHVIAMAISDDENELFVNVRSWPENAVPTMNNPPPIASQIETIVIDLNTLERTTKVGLLNGILDLAVNEAFAILFRKWWAIEVSLIPRGHSTST